MSLEIVYEVHSTSTDNETGHATGWLPGRLSTRGRRQAEELGLRRRSDTISAVFTSDLHRSMETAEIAFGATDIPILADWRLRECNYGSLNGADASLVHGAMRLEYMDSPYPGGESWTQAIYRVIGALVEIARQAGSGRVLVIGHKATGWACRHALERIEIADLISGDLRMPHGSEYLLSDWTELWSRLPVEYRIPFGQVEE